MKKIKKILLLSAIIIIVLLIIVVIPESRKELKTKHFTFLFSSNIDTIKIAELSNALESSYLRIGNDLKTTPVNNIETSLASPTLSAIIANCQKTGNCICPFLY